jgi:hypothetical protein
MTEDATLIEEALRERFLVAIPSASGKTAFENQAFDPKGVPVWFEFHYMPNPSDVDTLGSGGWDLFTGICQIDIHVPKGSGRKDAKPLIAALRSSFTPASPIVYGPLVVTVRRCGQVPGGVEDNSFRFPVSITWEARVSRP